ncbi:DUF4405 domain-containing protein [Candidatus Gracilibacteria bacterium]|nr:DUF4405 domain-containing protein [Candidatus Gracilibacteria bacterium]
MFIFFFITSITGLIIFFFLPSGVRQGRFQEFMGITKEVWNFIHVWSGILIIIFVILHLILHYNWIICMTKNLFSKKNCKN